MIYSKHPLGMSNLTETFAHTLEATGISQSDNKKNLEEERRLLEENKNKYANDFLTNTESLSLKYKENIAVKGLSHQEQMEIYRKYKQNLDKIEVDYKKIIQKAQKRCMKQTITKCSICYTDMDCNDESLVTALQCGHEFHTNCMVSIQAWFEKNPNTCPYCWQVCTLQGRQIQIFGAI